VRRLLVAGLRRSAYVLVAWLVDLACLGLAAAGRRPAAARLRAAALRLLRLRLAGPPDGPPAGAGLVRHALLDLPLALVGGAVSAYLWLVLLLNVGFPVRTGTSAEELADSWGGPSLAGAWAVHAVGGVLVFLLVGVPLMSGLAEVHKRLARRVLGAAP
jgi:hypothetical protein